MKKERKKKRLRWRKPTSKKLSVSKISAAGCLFNDPSCAIIDQS